MLRYSNSNTPARFLEGRRPEINLAGILDANTMAHPLCLQTQKIGLSTAPFKGPMQVY